MAKQGRETRITKNVLINLLFSPRLRKTHVLRQCWASWNYNPRIRDRGLPKIDRGIFIKFELIPRSWSRSRMKMGRVFQYAIPKFDLKNKIASSHLPRGGKQMKVMQAGIMFVFGKLIGIVMFSGVVVMF